MVLLTSSAISAAISGVVVCAFTFLLFLSGYVLQQQTVRSLQEAIRNPPEKPWFPTPTLPPQFQLPEDGLDSDQNEQTVQNDTDLPLNMALNDGQLSLGPVTEVVSADQAVSHVSKPTMKQLWIDYLGIDTPSVNIPNSQISQSGILEDDSKLLASQSQQRLAYILTISELSDLCAAALFVQAYRRQSKFTSIVSIVFIYPASWEISESPEHSTALDIIRDLKDTQGVICHPINISRVWVGVSATSQLLAELQRARWPYDRALYLRAPGLMLDPNVLDAALITSDVQQKWQKVTSKNTSNRPSMLLFTKKKGLLAPRGDMIQLTALVESNEDVTNTALAKEEAARAAYIIFDETDIERRRQGGDGSYTRLFEKFEKERQRVCLGTTRS